MLIVCWQSLPAQPKLKLIELDATFEQPVDMTKAQDGTDDIYITERLGKVYRYSRGDEKVRLVLDLSDIVVSKTLGGLLGLDFHPQFPDSSYFYVNYTTDTDDPDFPLESRISRFTMMENDRADLMSEYLIMSIKQPGIYHNLGDVAFGPDGYLYVPSGDGSLENDEYRAGQNPKVRLGKLLRIDIDKPGDTLNYSIPPDNPYAGNKDTLDEIWSMGLRNPRQLSFDRATNDLWIGDIGEFNYQEMNHQPAGNGGGQNYGWSCIEGLEPYALRDESCEKAKFYDAPRFAYPTTSDDGVNGKFIIGGYVYRGPVEALNGYFLFGDFLGSTLYAYDVDRPGSPIYNITPDDPVSNVSCFGESNDGSIFVASYNGKIFRMEAEEPSATPTSRVFAPLSLSPNPASREVTVTLKEAVDLTAEARLYDSVGKLVSVPALHPRSPRSLHVNLSGIAPGLYILHLSGGKATYSGKIVVR